MVDTASDSQNKIEVLLDPGPYNPRKSARKETRLRKEFQERSGDPNIAGVSNAKIITAYRQDAIRCAKTLGGGKILEISEIKALANVARAGSILQKNHYGWFEREARGVYRLSEHGETALLRYATVVNQLA